MVNMSEGYLTITPCSVALRAPERRVARSASPDLSDRALIRAAEQNRSSRSVHSMAIAEICS
jgi:hypothetical protein